MRKYLLLLILLSSFVISESYYEITLSNNANELKVVDLSVKPEPVENLGSTYVAELYAFDGDFVADGLFDFETNDYIFQIDQGRVVERKPMTSNKTVFSIPYFPNAKEIVILDDKFEEKLKIDVTKFSKVKKEALTNTLKETQTENKEKNSPDKNLFWYILISLFILLILLYITIKIRRE